MSNPLLIKDTAGAVTVYLTDTAGVAVTGLTASTVHVDLKKYGGDFYAKSLSGNFTDLGLGFYSITLSTTDTDTLGDLFIRVSGAAIKYTVSVATVLATAPTAPTDPLAPVTSYVFGFLYDVNGAPVENAGVLAKLLVTPTTYTSSLVLSRSPVVERTDSEGFFVLRLVAGTTVDIVISEANYRRVIVVPSTPTNLFDIA